MLALIFQARKEQGKLWLDIVRALLVVLAIGSSHFMGFLTEIPASLRSIVGITLAPSFFETLSLALATIAVANLIVKYLFILSLEWKYQLGRLVDLFIGLIKWPFKIVFLSLVLFGSEHERRPSVVVRLKNAATTIGSKNAIEAFPQEEGSIDRAIVGFFRRFSVILQCLFCIVMFSTGYSGYGVIESFRSAEPLVILATGILGLMFFSAVL